MTTFCFGVYFFYLVNAGNRRFFPQESPTNTVFKKKRKHERNVDKKDFACSSPQLSALFRPGKEVCWLQSKSFLFEI